jgi:hypothetical protein
VRLCGLRRGEVGSIWRVRRGCLLGLCSGLVGVLVRDCSRLLHKIIRRVNRAG